MRKTLKVLSLTMLMWVLFLYLGFSFVSQKPNPASWSEEARFYFFISSLFLVVGVTIMAYIEDWD